MDGTTTSDSEWDAIIKTWGHAYIFSHRPDIYPDKPYAARRKDRQGTIRAGTPALLLDAIKDDARARPFTLGAA
jgi:hypothetical protein